MRSCVFATLTWIFCAPGRGCAYVGPGWSFRARVYVSTLLLKKKCFRRICVRVYTCGPCMFGAASMKGVRVHFRAGASTYVFALCCVSFWFFHAQLLSWWASGHLHISICEEFSYCVLVYVF